MSNCARQGGFTLVEMLVVLGIMALLLAVSLPYASGSGDARKLDALAQTLAATLRDARSAALSSNRQHSVFIDFKTRTLTGSARQKPIRIPAAINLEIVSAENEAMPEKGTFRFFPDGGSSGGKIILAGKDMRREIAISWLTGAVIVSAGAAP